MNFSDVWNMQISRRKWFVNRLLTQLELEASEKKPELPPIPNLPK